MPKHDFDRDWTLLQPDRKRVFGSSLRHSEDATLSCGLAHSCHLQSQSFEIAHNKTLVAKRSISEMGYIALAILDTNYTTKSREGTSRGGFLGRISRSKIDQIIWRFPRWDCWSLHDSDILRGTSLATAVRWRIKNRS